MNKKHLFKAIIFIIISSIIISSIILYSKHLPILQNIRQKILKETNENPNRERTTIIDVTGIIAGKETQHEHIYKTMYNENKHWEECKSCGEKINEKAHSFTTTWAAGYESCQSNNYYINTCTCGYSYTGHKPCVWNGTSYYPNSYWHAKLCSICNTQIVYSYYLYKYGNGEIYDATITNQYVKNENGYAEKCHLSNGTILSCKNTGTCVVCNSNYNTTNHHLFAEPNTGRIYCEHCNQDFGTYSETITTSTTSPTTYTIVGKFKLTNGAYLKDKENPGYVFYEGDPWEIQSQIVNEIDDTWQNFTVTTTAKFKSNWSEKYRLWIFTIMNIAGVKVDFCRYDSIFYPDLIKPIISGISIGNSNTWNKSRTITISGKENWTSTVKVEIVNDKDETIYIGKGNVDWSNYTESNPFGDYSISCTPDLEAGIEGRTFKAIVTDACENSIEQEFTISKIDGIVPEVTSNNEIAGNWAKEKNFTFTATDQGIGNVQIAFNDVSDYKLATKNGIEYSREYKLIGDIYTPTNAMVFYKDELGNTTSQEITIDKLDNTTPTITNASVHNNKLIIQSNDVKEGLGEGSGVVKYKFITSTTKLEIPIITEAESTEVKINDDIIIPNIDKVKYVYVAAEDLVGNVSEVYEIRVPQLELTSKVNLSAANGKGEINLDWSNYDISDKYFVIYRKEKDANDWETIVDLNQKYIGNKYTDTLGSDKETPNIPNIDINSNQENNNINITASTSDNGSKYTYYIEAYDSINMNLLSISNLK